MEEASVVLLLPLTSPATKIFSEIFLYLVELRRCSRIGSIQEIIERYRRHTKDKVQLENQSVSDMQHETASLMKKIELLESSKRKLLGEGLGSCTLKEVQQIEKQLERCVSTIRAQKMQVYSEQMERLKEKEKALAAENAMMREKFGGLQQRTKSKEGEVDLKYSRGWDPEWVERCPDRDPNKCGEDDLPTSKLRLGASCQMEKMDGRNTS
ncbi:hypothetical protein K7X08_007976 [Anisodus acutangulus]|uniref:K-box domain-containing protein n=1 Tax=Anisodus acutangulus TaxID=402998 RepID=A0A9Q1RKY9_9SOLA|nr:hypothetical protein K7X08_007976 [Anisodus acutangulus]